LKTNNQDYTKNVLFMLFAATCDHGKMYLINVRRFSTLIFADFSPFHVPSFS